MMAVDDVLSSLVYLAACFVLFLLGKWVYQLIHPKIKVAHELVEKDNPAFAISMTGYYIGLLTIIGSALIGESYGLWVDLMDIGLYGAIGIVLLNLSAFINDKVILRHFKIHEEIIETQNVGTGIVEAGNYVATGLITFGAIIGEGGHPGTALLAWLACQVVLIIAAAVYNLITPYNIHDHIAKGNIPVAIGFAGAMVALGNILRFAVEIDFVDWLHLAENLAIDAALGLVLLPIVRFLTDKLLLPGQKITDELINQEHPNLGAGLIEAFAYIGGSVLITWVI